MPSILSKFGPPFVKSLIAVSAIFLSSHVGEAQTPPKKFPQRKAGTKQVRPTDALKSDAAKVAATDESVPPGADDEIEKIPRKSGINIDSKSAIRLNYGRRDWNSDATKIDEAIIFLREGTTGRIVQIQAEESAPDSASFSGTYSINWRNIESLRLEFYAPPQKLLADVAGRRKISQMIDSKELRRLPFVLRKDPVSGLQNIELFDNVEQARTAYRAFQSEQQLLQALQGKTAQRGQPVNPGALSERDQTVDTAALADRAEFEKLSRDLAERVRLGQIESQRLSQLIQSFSALTPAQRAARKTQAQAAADQAMIDYRAERYTEAKSSFDKAVELDPTNRSYYFQYGVTLYKLDEYNRSLVYLDLADGKGVNVVEKDFYRGLNYYRLKNSENAIAAFGKVVDAKDVEISPSANFYRGLVFFEKKSWPEARTEFQAVLDQSKDPALDERAEAYLENILRQQQFDAERAKRWTLSGTLGALYDDNVLLSSDSDRDRGTVTNLEAFRTLLVGSARYRPLYEENREFAAQLDVMTMYSVGTDFQSTQSLANADPTIVGLTLPWTYKGVFRGKGYKFDFVPGYEMTYMSIENNEMKAIYNSALIGFQNLFVMNERWYMNVNVDLRQDTSALTSSTGDNNSSALKTKLTWSNINFLEDKKQLILSDVSYTSNAALGKNSVFNRIDLGAGYVFPWKWDTTVLSKLSYYLLTYPENSNGRVDNSATVTLGLSRPWTEKLMLGLTGTYTMNTSNVEANQYKKFNLMATLSATEVF